LKTSVKKMFYEVILAQNRTEIWGEGRQLPRFVITMQNGNRRNNVVGDCICLRGELLLRVHVQNTLWPQLMLLSFYEESYIKSSQNQACNGRNGRKYQR